MADGDVVLGSQIAALIVVLHNEGIVNAHSIREQIELGIEFQPEHRAVLEAAVARVRMLADALAPFEPRIPNATPPIQTG